MTQQESGRMPDHDAVRRYYNDEYYRDKPGSTGLPWHVRRVARRLGLLRGKAALDVACGTGEWLQELVRCGAQPSGIDISARAVKLAKRRLPHSDIREGVAEQLPFADSYFDLVTCMGSLEHFLNQPGALEEMCRVMKPGARLLILVPNAGFLTRRLGLYRGTGQIAIRETVRSLAEWRQLLRQAGFAIEAEWRDLHPLSASWIMLGSPLAWPLRAAQALTLALWPVAWQYQVYFWCRRR